MLNSGLEISVLSNVKKKSCIVLENVPTTCVLNVTYLCSTLNFQPKNNCSKLAISVRSNLAIMVKA